MKILIADDHTLFREGLVLLLRSLVPDVETVEAGTCDEAFAATEGASGIDLVLMDLAMPGMPGLDGITQLRLRHPEIPVVALSSSDDRETILKALDAGAMGFVPKSSSSGVLAGALKLIMSKGIYLPAEVFLENRSVSIASSQVASHSPAQTTKETIPADLGLTPRQSDVLYLILQGKAAKLICRELGLSSSTVKVHTSAVLRALNVTTRTQAVVAAGRLGMRFGERPRH